MLSKCITLNGAVLCYVFVRKRNFCLVTDFLFPLAIWNITKENKCKIAHFKREYIHILYVKTMMSSCLIHYYIFKQYTNCFRQSLSVHGYKYHTECRYSVQCLFIMVILWDECIQWAYFHKCERSNRLISIYVNGLCNQNKTFLKSFMCNIICMWKRWTFIITVYVNS